MNDGIVRPDGDFRRFDARLRVVLEENPEEEERLMETPASLLLECFEASLADFDHLLATFPHELPDGWEDWLPDPPRTEEPAGGPAARAAVPGPAAAAASAPAGTTPGPSPGRRCGR